MERLKSLQCLIHVSLMDLYNLRDVNVLFIDAVTSLVCWRGHPSLLRFALSVKAWFLFSRMHLPLLIFFALSLGFLLQGFHMLCDVLIEFNMNCQIHEPSCNFQRLQPWFLVFSSLWNRFLWLHIVSKESLDIETGFEHPSNNFGISIQDWNIHQISSKLPPKINII